MNKRLMLPFMLGMAAIGGGSYSPIRGGGRSLSKYSPLRPDAMPKTGKREAALRVRQMERNAAKRAA